MVWRARHASANEHFLAGLPHRRLCINTSRALECVWWDISPLRIPALGPSISENKKTRSFIHQVSYQNCGVITRCTLCLHPAFNRVTTVYFGISSIKQLAKSADLYMMMKARIWAARVEKRWYTTSTAPDNLLAVNSTAM